MCLKIFIILQFLSSWRFFITVRKIRGDLLDKSAFKKPSTVVHRNLRHESKITPVCLRDLSDKHHHHQTHIYALNSALNKVKKVYHKRSI